MAKKKSLEKILGLREVLEILLSEGVPAKNLTDEYIKRIPEAKEFKESIKDVVEDIIESESDDFFEITEGPKGTKSTFVPKLLANKVKSHYFFKTTNGDETIYVYQDGVYLPTGDTIIKEEAEKLLGNKTRQHYVNEVVFDVRVSTYERQAEKKNIWLINMKNGIFNLKEMTVTPHDEELFLITQLPVKYNPEADCPNIKKFLSEIIIKEDIPIIQELFGYCLWRDYHIQKAFMFVGDGANGKSTLINVFKSFLGVDNISSVALQEIGTNRFAMARLHGKLANIYPDLPDAALRQTGRFKMLTGGDPIEAERKFKKPFNFTNYAKLIYSTNKVPETDDPSSAFFRRWVFVNFPNKFEGEKADKKMIDKITTEEELSGLFNWAIDGLKRILERGIFSKSISTEKTRDLYERMSSPVAAFVKDMTKFESLGYTTKSKMYKKFINYCKKNNLPTVANNIFARKLLEFAQNVVAGRMKIEGRQTTVWQGIILLTPEEKKNKGGLEDFV